MTLSTIDDLQERIDNGDELDILSELKAIIAGDDDGETRRAAFMAWQLDEGNTIDASDISLARYDECAIEYGREEYLVLTDCEADVKCSDHIADSLWAFNASFLSSETGIPEEMFSGMQEKCESANDSFRKCIDKTCGLDSFVSEAISADGRGHFLASYDGDENEFTIDGKTFYFYRVN